MLNGGKATSFLCYDGLDGLCEVPESLQETGWGRKPLLSGWGTSFPWSSFVTFVVNIVYNHMLFHLFSLFPEIMPLRLNCLGQSLLLGSLTSSYCNNYIYSKSAILQVTSLSCLHQHFQGESLSLDYYFPESFLPLCQISHLLIYCLSSLAKGFLLTDECFYTVYKHPKTKWELSIAPAQIIVWSLLINLNIERDYCFIFMVYIY